jgi:phosphonopyruvate decarboxylase
MIDPGAFLKCCLDSGIEFYAGVPDSLLKEFLQAVSDQIPESQHFICANEGNAVALCAGYHMGSGRLPLCYLQNSGLGNAVNPLTSLVHEQVYAIPLLLMVGWRGEPGRPDEPQHRAAGELTPKLLDNLGIEFETIGADCDFPSVVSTAARKALSLSKPVGLLVQAGAFSTYEKKKAASKQFGLKREEAIEAVAQCLTGDEAVVCTTGHASRELFELRARNVGSGEADFLNVGAMGHVSQIALGVAVARPERTVVCIDGDGSAIMHLGGLSRVAQSGAKNLKHIVLNNGAHDSVGGQPTDGLAIDLPAVAKALGYKFTLGQTGKAGLEDALRKLLQSEGPGLLEIRIDCGHRKDLGRPPSEFRAGKEAFMRFLNADRARSS